jgi:hypothetical protein
MAPVLDSSEEWRAKVQYEYAVADKTYGNDILSLQEGAGRKTADMWTIVGLGRCESLYLDVCNRALKEFYPSAGTVTVYYNPADPAQACLQRVSYSWLLVVFLVPVVSLPISVWCLRRSWRRLRAAV